MPNLNPKVKKYIRPVIAILTLILGGVFMLIPFIPLGYVLIFVGLFLLTPYSPKLKKWIQKLKKNDDKHVIEDAEKKVEESEEKINTWLTEDSTISDENSGADIGHKSH